VDARRALIAGGPRRRDAPARSVPGALRHASSCAPFLARQVWTEREATIFHDRYLQYPKNFRKVAAFLEYKSVQDCVQFYYTKKHKLDLKRALQKHQKKPRGGVGATPRSAVTPPAKPVEDIEYVTNPFRSGMRARARNFSYNESEISGAASSGRRPRKP
jgi:hypothetical protein